MLFAVYIVASLLFYRLSCVCSCVNTTAVTVSLSIEKAVAYKSATVKHPVEIRSLECRGLSYAPSV